MQFLKDRIDTTKHFIYSGFAKIALGVFFLFHRTKIFSFGDVAFAIDLAKHFNHFSAGSLPDGHVKWSQKNLGHIQSG